jgi:two-component system OmpR family sensor kinase
MPSSKIKSKWRPPLALIVYAVLLVVLALPIVIVIWFRAIEPTSGRMAPTEVTALVVALLLTLVVGYVLTRTIARPLMALIARTDAIARGGREAIRPLDSHGTREIATLSQSFLTLASQLVDRTEYVRSFAAHVSHELKSPLTAIRGASELLRDDEGDGLMTKAQRRHFLDNIIADAERLDELLVRLRELAHAELPMIQGQTSAADASSELVRRFPGLMIASRGDIRAPIALPPEAMGIVLDNLAQNSLEHGATMLELRVSVEGRTVKIVVSDNGSGIPDVNRDLIFQPFFSTRRESGGTGIGLDIVRAMLASHGGSIRLIDVGGAQFEISLPTCT